MTRAEGRAWCALHRLPTRYVLHERQHYLCVQTVLLKIFLGLPIPKGEDITDYTPGEEIPEKLKELKGEE